MSSSTSLQMAAASRVTHVLSSAVLVGPVLVLFTGPSPMAPSVVGSLRLLEKTRTCTIRRRHTETTSQGRIFDGPSSSRVVSNFRDSTGSWATCEALLQSLRASLEGMQTHETGMLGVKLTTKPDDVYSKCPRSGILQCWLLIACLIAAVEAPF